jgi:hypothetical protein
MWRIFVVEGDFWRLATGEVCRAFSNPNFSRHSGFCDDAGARSRYMA